MAMQLFSEIREAREAYQLPLREAGIKLKCGDRSLENYEYKRARAPLEVIRAAAEEFKSPELLDQAWSEYPQEWPHIPLPRKIETSLLANVAKAAKEACENIRGR